MVLMGMSHPKNSLMQIEEPGIRLPELVQKIGEATGESLSVSPELSNEVFAIWQKDIDAKEMKAKLADIAYASWSTRSNGQVLIPDTERLRKIETDWTRRLGESVADGKRLIRALLNGQFPIPAEVKEDYEWVASMYDDPGAKLWAQIALQIPDSVYTGLTEDERAVYSTTPNRMQRPLNIAGINQIVNSWIDTYNKGIEEIEEIDDSEYPPEYREYYELLKEMGMDYMPKKITEKPAKVLAIVNGAYPSMDERYVNTPYLRLVIFGESGKQLTTYENSIGSLVETYKGMMDYAKNKAKYECGGDGGDEGQYQDPYKDSPRLPLSADSWEMIQAVKGQYSGREQVITPRAAEMLKDPVNYEPLRYLLGESYISMAKHFDKPLFVLLMDDDARNLTYEATAEGVRPMVALDLLLRRDVYYSEGELYAQSGSSAGFTQESYGGAKGGVAPTGPIEVGPREPKKFWDLRMKREDLVEMYQIYEQEGRPNLDTLASFAARNPNAPYNSVKEIVLMPVSGPGYDMWGQSNDWESLMLWGHLGSANQKTIRSGGRVPISGLSKEAREFLTETLFGNYSNLGEIEKQRRKPAYMSQGWMGEEGGYYEGMMGLTSEPTEIMPNGLPANGYLEGIAVTEPYVIQLGSTNKPNTYLSMAMSPSDVAFSRALYEMVGDQSEIQPGHFNRLALGQRTSIEMAIVVAPGVGQVRQYLDDQKPDTSRTYSMLSLPTEFARLVAEEEKKMNASKEMKLMRAMYKMNGSYREPIKP